MANMWSKFQFMSPTFDSWFFHLYHNKYYNIITSYMDSKFIFDDEQERAQFKKNIETRNNVLIHS